MEDNSIGKDNTVGTKVLLKSGLLYTVAGFLSRAMVFITMPLFLRLLTKEQYGDFSVYSSWQSTLMVIFGLEVYSTLNRARFDYVQEGELDGYISSSLVLSSLFTVCFIALYLVFPGLFDWLFRLDRKYMMIMFAYLLTYPAFAMFTIKQRIEYKYKLYLSIAFPALFLSYVLSLILVLNMDSDRLFGRIIGQYSIYILIGLAFYLYFIRRSCKITVGSWKYALRLGLPMVFAYLGSQILLSSDSVVVKHMCSAADVSYLSITHSCSHIIIVLVQTANNAWSPWFFDMLKADRIKTIRKAYLIVLWLIIIITFGVILLGPEIIMVFGGRTYLESVYLLPAYILCGIFTVLTSQFSNLETYHKKTEYSAIFTSIAAVCNVVLNIVGVRFWGYRAVCYSTLICQLLLVTLHYIFTPKMRIRELLPVKSLLLVLVASLLLIPVGLLLYQSNVIRWICIATCVVIIAAGLIINREKIRTMVRAFRHAD